MIVTGLRLRGFRNYGSCEVEFHPGINLIVGANAQGKTNLIESLGGEVFVPDKIPSSEE